MVALIIFSESSAPFVFHRGSCLENYRDQMGCDKQVLLGFHLRKNNAVHSIVISSLTVISITPLTSTPEAGFIIVPGGSESSSSSMRIETGDNRLGLLFMSLAIA